jgi:hypothetical protein
MRLCKIKQPPTIVGGGGLHLPGHAPTKKNDSCHVEQKNWVVVRRVIGYQPFSSKAAFKALDDIYALLRLYINFFQPVLKLARKTRHGAKVHKVYDKAQTPYQRPLRSEVLDEDRKRELTSIYSALNPVSLLKQIREEVEYLWTLAEPQPSTSRRCSSDTIFGNRNYDAMI